MRRKAGNVRDWANKQCPAKVCPNVIASPVAAEAPAPTAQGEEEMIIVSRATARTVNARRMKARRERRQENRKARQHAEKAIANALVAQAWQSLPEIRARDTVVNVHQSHGRALECGGYVGCMRCGRFASTSSAGNKLALPCRGSCPNGSKGATERLRKGHHPLGSKGTKWPNNESAPTPRRIVP